MNERPGRSAEALQEITREPKERVSNLSESWWVGLDVTDEEQAPIDEMFREMLGAFDTLENSTGDLETAEVILLSLTRRLGKLPIADPRARTSTQGTLRSAIELLETCFETIRAPESQTVSPQAAADGFREGAEAALAGQDEAYSDVPDGTDDFGERTETIFTGMAREKFSERLEASRRDMERRAHLHTFAADFLAAAKALMSAIKKRDSYYEGDILKCVSRLAKIAAGLKYFTSTTLSEAEKPGFNKWLDGIMRETTDFVQTFAAFTRIDQQALDEALASGDRIELKINSADPAVMSDGDVGQAFAQKYFTELAKHELPNNLNAMIMALVAEFSAFISSLSSGDRIIKFAEDMDRITAQSETIKEALGRVETPQIYAIITQMLADMSDQLNALEKQIRKIYVASGTTDSASASGTIEDASQVQSSVKDRDSMTASGVIDDEVASGEIREEDSLDRIRLAGLDYKVSLDGIDEDFDPFDRQD